MVCEGEKDCETARALNLVATCNPHGAGKWRPKFADALKGKRICIIADADEPGRKRMAGTVDSLIVVDLPGAKDLTGVAHGGTREGLLQIAARCNRMETKDAGGWWVHAFTPERVAHRSDVPVEYVVGHLLVSGTVSCVAAKPKVGKSTFARNLCLAVSRGDKLLGFETKRPAQRSGLQLGMEPAEKTALVSLRSCRGQRGMSHNMRSARFLGSRVNFLRGMGPHHDMERTYNSQVFNIESCSFEKSTAIILIKNMMMQASIFNVEQGPSLELLRRPCGWIERKIMQGKNLIEMSFVLLIHIPFIIFHHMTNRRGLAAMVECMFVVRKNNYDRSPGLDDSNPFL